MTGKREKRINDLATPSDYYLQLINTFPPRPISNDAELIATQARIDSILDKQKIVRDDKDYIKVLGTLVYDYEKEREPMPVLRGIELLKALMNEGNLQPQDLISIFGSEANVIEVLNERQEITVEQTQKLGNFFHLSPTRFVAKD